MNEISNVNEIYSKVQEIVAEVLNIDKEKINMDSKIVQDLGAESLDIVTMLMEFEDHFKSPIPDEAAFKLVTIKDIVTYVSALKAS